MLLGVRNGDGGLAGSDVYFCGGFLSSIGYLIVPFSKGSDETRIRSVVCEFRVSLDGGSGPRLEHLPRPRAQATP